MAKRDQFRKNAGESEKFFKDLSGRTTKLNVVAEYYGKGMFTNLSDETVVPSRTMGAEVEALMGKI